MKRGANFFLFLLFLSAGCRESQQKDGAAISPELLAAAHHAIDTSKPFIANGDIIFRNGRDAVSQAARSMNRTDTSFSHCGLVFRENDSVFVYHALGGHYNPSQKLRREPIESFCDPAENNAFAIYRYNLDQAANEKLKKVVENYYRAGIKFDMYFNFFSDDVMYCAEFVFKSLNKAVNGAYGKYLRLDTLPYGVTTDDLFLNEHCRPVLRQQFGW